MSGAGLGATRGDEYTQLRDALRAAAQSVYIVNEKHPRTYNRAWKVYVLWRDHTRTTRWTDDSPAALRAELRRLLADPRAVPDA